MPLGFTPDMIAIGRGGDGDLYGATARASTGYVREFAVFDSVLTQAEVAAYHNELVPPPPAWATAVGIVVVTVVIGAVLCVGFFICACCCKDK